VFGDQTIFYLGLGVGMSVLGFFLKRLKADVDQQKEQHRNTELLVIRLEERLIVTDKVLEDRRRDIKDIYAQLK
jgi:hypothetical protein